MRKAVSKMLPRRQKSANDQPGLEQTLQPDKPATGPIASPFKIDFNSVSDFYISLDKPHNSWLPGDEVSGQIILISKKNLVDIVITLSLVGFVKINASSHSKLRPIKHSLFNHTIKIYGEEGNTTEEFSSGLFKGEHRFPFIVKLPNKRIFTSIDFGKGSITYLLKASMADTALGNGSSSNIGNVTPGSAEVGPDGSSPGFLSKTRNLKIMNNINYTSEKLINLINPIDVSTLPDPKPKRLIIKDPRGTRRLSRTQSSNSTINTFTTLSSNNSDSNETPVSNTPGLTIDHGLEATPDPVPQSSSVSYDVPRPENIKVTLNIPRKGYLRGELIPIKLNIQHLRKIQDVNGIIVTFVRVCRLDNGPEGLYDSFRKDLVQSVIPIYVDPITFTSEISTNIRIPADAFPTISGCPLVSFQYFVEILINLSGKPVTFEGDGVKSAISAPDPTRSTSSGISEDRVANTLNDFKQQFKYLSNDTSDLNLKERSNFINTDKFKRMKKFLQLTSEVVVGTHRLNVLNDEMQVGNSPLSGISPPVSSGSPGMVITPGTTGVAAASPLDTAIPESNEFDDAMDVPNYNEANGGVELLPLPNEQDGLTEKERVRAHETGLLPSAPPDVLENDTDSPTEPPTEPQEPFNFLHSTSLETLDPTNSGHHQNGEYLPQYQPSER